MTGAVEAAGATGTTSVAAGTADGGGAAWAAPRNGTPASRSSQSPTTICGNDLLSIGVPPRWTLYASPPPLFRPGPDPRLPPPSGFCGSNMLKTPRTSDVEGQARRGRRVASFQDRACRQAREPTTPEGWPLLSLVPLAPGFAAGSHHDLVERSAVEQELPIIQIRNCLLVSIQTELHDRLALDLQASLMDRVRTVNARGVILDVSAVE